MHARLEVIGLIGTGELMENGILGWKVSRDPDVSGPGRTYDDNTPVLFVRHGDGEG